MLGQPFVTVAKCPDKQLQRSDLYLGFTLQVAFLIHWLLQPVEAEHRSDRSLKQSGSRKSMLAELLPLPAVLLPRLLGH